MFRKHLTTGKGKTSARIFGLSLTLLIICNVNIYAQNINTAKNGLTKESDTVLLGGTLTRDTDIDLGTFNLGFKKGSTPYFNVMNNGSIRLGKFLNNSGTDSILTTDSQGNLMFLSIADAFGQFSVGNDFGISAPFGPAIRFMNTPNSIYPLLWLYNGESQFRMEASNISIYNTDASGATNLTIFSTSFQAESQGEGGNLRGKIGTDYYGSAYMSAQYVDPNDPTHYNIAFVDTNGFQFNGNDSEKFKIVRDGTVRLFKYLNNENEDSILTTDFEGNLKFKSIASLASLAENGGIVNQGGMRLGGALSATELTMTGDDPFEIKTDDNRSFRIWRDYEGREQLIALRNWSSELALQRGDITASVDYGLNYSRISTNGYRNFSMVGNGETGRLSYVVQDENGDINLRIAAEAEGNPTHDNTFLIDTTGFGFATIAGPKFSIKNDGTLNLQNYLNNVSEDQVLTTDVNGNLKFKTLSQSDLTFLEGLTRIGDSVRLGGTLLQNGSLIFNDPQGLLPSTAIDWNNGTLRLLANDTGNLDASYVSVEKHQVLLGRGLSQIALNNEGTSMSYNFGYGSDGGSYIWNGNESMMLNVARTCNDCPDWSRINMMRGNLEVTSGEVIKLETGFKDKTIYINPQGIDLKTANSMQSGWNALRVNNEGMKFGNIIQQGVEYAGEDVDPVFFSVNGLGQVNFPLLKNDETESQILTTDIDGFLKLKPIAETVPSLSYLNGLTKSGDSVMLGGDLFRNTQINLFDSSFVLKGSDGIDSLSMSLFKQGQRFFQLNYRDWAIDHNLIFNDMFALTRISPGSNNEFYVGQNGLHLQHMDNIRNYLTMLQAGDGKGGFHSIRGEGSSAKISVSSVNHFNPAPDQEPTQEFLEEVSLFAETEGKGNKLTVDSAGFTFTNQIAGTLDLVRAARIGHNGRITFDNYKNNTAGDSVLTTDAAGNLRLKYFAPSSGGGGADSAWAYDSIHIYNRNEGNVGIGTHTPTAKLHTLGSVRFETFKNNLQGDSVLTTDPDGNLKFVYLPYGSGGGSGGEYTFKNGLLQANGTVSLGGQLEDSAKIDLGGHLFELHDGASKVLSIAPSGNVGIGSAASNFKLTIDGETSLGNIYDSVGAGRALWFNGYANADPLFIRRHNTGSDASELRVNIGDDGGSPDKFRVGHYIWNSPDEWITNFLVQANGQAAIGTSDITGELAIGKQHGIKLSVGNLGWAKTSILYTGNDQANGDYTDLLVPGSNTNNAIVRLNQNGNVGIGTLEPDAAYRLSVNGKIRAKGLRVQSTGWADFVFEPGYSLMRLPELEKFVKINKHLPGIPTAAEVSKSGQDVGETQVQLLQKIEELTLYIIELNKQVKTLEDKNKKLEAQQSQIDRLQQQLEDMRKMILNK